LEDEAMTGKSIVLLLLATALLAGAIPATVLAAGLPNPFYAMDTSFQRPGLTPDEQLDLVKQLGFPGVAWHEQTPEELRSSLAALEKRGLKMFTIYCPAKVTPEGDLSYSPQLPAIIETLKGHCQIVWLHLGGKGPAFDALTGQEPVVRKLRELSDTAKQNALQIAIYPHLGEWTARFGDATKLAKLVNRPNFGVCFNLCHCLAVGDEEQIPTLLKEAGALLLTVTISGADSGVSGSGQWNRLIQTLDKGTFDMVELLRKLRQNGFTGPIGFQGYGIKEEPRAILVPTIEAWRKLSAAAARD
jgi:sugar phosphate isomerase/epimerase